MTTVTPYEVKGIIDYDKLTRDFGAQQIDQKLLDRMEQVTGKPLHPFLRRGVYYSHRDLDRILDLHERGQPFYLYTGRGPSSSSLHIGHVIQFMFTKYLQELFNVPLVIQITDDEKFFVNQDLTLAETRAMARENVKDIIACGFDVNKTFIFLNSDYIGQLYTNICRIQRKVNVNQVKKTFGFTDEDNCGKFAFPAIQIAPCFSSSFPHIFGTANVPCLIPCAIDQDPYFRMTRDIAHSLDCEKPALIHSKFIASLKGLNGKMSSSDPTTAIYISDTKDEIRNKVMKHAFSGGRETAREHKQYGGNCDIDVSYIYLSFFLDDDKELEQIRQDYTSGKMLSGTLKQRMVNCITPVLQTIQDARKNVTDDMVDLFMSPRPIQMSVTCETHGDDHCQD